MILPDPTLHPYKLPLRGPLQLLDRTLTDREGAIAVLTCYDGTALYADICPLPTIHNETLAEACKQWQDTVVPLLKGLVFDPAGLNLKQPCLGLLRTADGDPPVIGALWQALYPSVAFALEAALLCGWSSYQDASTPSKDLDYAVVFYPRSTRAWLTEARQAYADGHRLFKIKIGGDRWPQQQAEIGELLSSCPELTLRLDANRQLTAEDCQDLSSWPVQFVEDLADGAQDSPWPTAIDDGLWDRDIPDDTPEPPADHDVLVLKPSRLKGGLSSAWRWLSAARRHRRRAHLSSCYESGLGLRAQLILQRLAVERFGSKTVLSPGFSPYLALAEDVLVPPLPLWQGTARLPHIAAQTPRGLSGFDWLTALGQEGVCLITPAGGQVTYAELRSRVVQQVARLQGIPATTWRLAADDTLTVWAATLACLCSGHRLLPVHSKTPESQLEAWASLCPMQDWPPPATTHHAHQTGVGSGELLIATSGSTGLRKLARLTSRGLYFSALGTNRFYDLQAEDRWGLCLPLFHVGGLMILLRATLAGAAVIQLPARYDRKAEALYQQTSVLSVVPSQWQEFVDNCPGKVMSHLKAVIIGGAATPATLKKESIQRDLPISLTYGMTEAGAQLLASAPGTASPMVPLDFRAVTLNPAGRVAFRGPMAFAGYVGQRAHDSGRWFETQDIGKWRENGLAIIGRADRQIIKGGENIPLALAERIAGELGLMARSVPYNHHRYGQWYRLVIASPEIPVGSEVEAALAKAMPKFWLPEVIIWRSSVGLAGIKLSAAEAEQAVADHLDGLSRPSD